MSCLNNKLIGYHKYNFKREKDNRLDNGKL